MTVEIVLAELGARRSRTDEIIANLSPGERRKLQEFADREGLRLSVFERRFAANFAERTAQAARDIQRTHEDDFQAGYTVGYRGHADTRSVFGTLAYRQGYAYGVQQAVAERAERARTAQPRAFWRYVVLGAVLGLLLGFGLVKCAAADTLQDWQALNEVCQGGAGATSDKACTQRQRFGAQLQREGWYQGAHGVWVSPENVATFNRIVRSYDALARENTGMLDSVMQAMMTDLRRQLPAEAIFALWNGRAGDLLAHTPYAASMLMYGLPYLERMLSGKNDPRYRMAVRL